MIGPITSGTNADCQLVTLAMRGRSWILPMVRRNPKAVCAVRAVPITRWSAVSLNAVEKTPESAMTAAPHTPSTRSPYAQYSGESRQQAPLITRAVTADGARPIRSAA